MLSVSYIAALTGTIGLGVVQFAMYSHIGRFYGQTLSQWIERTRNKNDEYSAEKLIIIRKQFEILAHDILKHRLLGLTSLVEEIKEVTEGGSKIQKLSLEQQTAFRTEIFRLAGLKFSPEERLWSRWRECLTEIYRQASFYTAAPPIDPMFRDNIRALLSLRRLLMSYVDEEKSPTDFLRQFLHLPFERCENLYPTVLQIIDGCRMIVDPELIVKKAVNAVASQTSRKDLLSHITIYPDIPQKLLCPAASGTIVMFLTRLIDNAIQSSRDAAISVELFTDDFTGSSSLLFKVYDRSETIPKPNEYGMGIRGIKSRITAFSGGFQYVLETRDDFRKAAVLSFPVSDYCDIPVSKLPKSTLFLISSACVITLGIFGICVAYVLGGPPVEFAGEGQNITEFSVNVGEELRIPLCSGGRNVRVETHLVNEICPEDNCSFSDVLDALEPCEHQITDPDCPNEIRWTPKFEDGQRQGKNYELTVHCISDGPPSSEDSRRIRVLVSRPNSAPHILLAQIINQTRNTIHYIKPGETIRTGVSDDIMLNVMASDNDADVLTYKLRQPDGKVLTSADGTFALKADWSLFATSTFELAISDSFAKPVKLPIILEADEFHPVEIQSAGIWSPGNSTKQICEGNAELRICQLSDRLSNVFELQVWFDPLQRQIKPHLEIQPTGNLGFDIRPIAPHHDNETLLGDQWEILTRNSHQLLAVIELTNIEKTSTPGLFHFTFNLLTTPVTAEINSLALNFSFSELNGKIPQTTSMFVFSRQESYHQPFTFSSRRIELTEAENDVDLPLAQSDLWIYPSTSDRSTGRPSIGPIVCQTPEFAEAIMPPEVHEHHNAWRFVFRLIPGCIPGLAPDMPAKNRLCAADIYYGNNQKQSEAFWIFLNPRSCQPRIETLSLTSSHEQLKENQFRWRFKITDPDGDLQANAINITGLKTYSLSTETDPNARGNAYTGEIGFDGSCSTIQPKDIALRVRDNAGHELLQSLNPTLTCPPLAKTDTGNTTYHVDDDTMLTIPILHDGDVHLSLNSRIGRLNGDTFEWQASCVYGNGPHTVEIRTESLTRTGQPLQLEIHVENCLPKFNIRIDDTPFPTSQLRLMAGKTRRLTIQSDRVLSDWDAVPRTKSAIPHVTLTRVEAKDAWSFDMTCDEPDTQDDLEIELRPPNNTNVNLADPIRLQIQCVQPSGDEDVK